MSQSSIKPAFVLVHGAWASRKTWTALTPELEKRGNIVVSVDLPGAGPKAAAPASFLKRPLELAEFGTEPSPNAGVTQAERTNATITAVHHAARIGNGNVILVGHSLGGLTLSAVAEQIPEQVNAVVYLAAFMLPSGMNTLEVTSHEAMEGTEVPPLFCADPSTIGALRVDTRSSDPEYVSKVKSAFYGEISNDLLAAALADAHCDEPTSVYAEPSTITSKKFGSVDRHYVRCARDRAIVPKAQDLMLHLVDQQTGTTTTVHKMDTCHSPHISDPSNLAEVLSSIANNSPLVL